VTCALTTRALAVAVEAAAFDPAVRRYGSEQLAALSRHAPVPVHAASLTLAAAPADGTAAKARLELAGGTARVHVVAETAEQAVDRATERLRRQLRAMRDGPHPSRAVRERGPWEFGAAPTDRPAYAPRPVAQRSISRRKPYELRPFAPEAAITTAALLDYDFFLFVSAPTRRPAVVRRRNGTTWEFADAARCTVADAAELLNVTNARFVCFADGPCDGLHALYRRFDGNYGLLTPA
jgi:hypothetical protein